MNIELVLFPNKDISRCPAIIFAVNRTDRDPGRIIFLIVSIIIMNGIRTGGVPIGSKWLNITLYLLIHPYSINDNHNGSAMARENTKWADDVNTYGSNPIKLLIKINIIIEINIIDDPLYGIRFFISILSLLITDLISHDNLLGIIQYLYGIIIIKIIVLIQFIDK